MQVASNTKNNKLLITTVCDQGNHSWLKQPIFFVQLRSLDFDGYMLSM